MRVTTVLCGGAVLLAALVAGPDGGVEAMATGGQARSVPLSVAAQQELVDDYCTVCHNDDLKIGDFSWTELDLAHPERNAAQAEKVIRKLRAGMMPPDEPQTGWGHPGEPRRGPRGPHR